MEISNNLLYILIATLAFNLMVVVGGMLFIRKVKRDQQRRQKTIVEQGKINSNLQETVELKNQTIKAYQQMTDGLV